MRPDLRDVALPRTGGVSVAQAVKGSGVKDSMKDASDTRTRRYNFDVQQRRILVVDDDPNILKVMQRGLGFEGYRVQLATSGEEALAAARQSEPDLIILDLMLPGVDGIEVCRRLRGGVKTPILMLTARDAVRDKIAGLEAGADDYLAKPFVFEELVARVRALLRRAAPDGPDVLSFADLTVDTGTREVTRGSRKVQLTAREYELLEFLLRHPRQVLTRELIFQRVWGFDFLGESNVIDVHVRALREKLESDAEPRLIQTVRGAGYALREE
jgi:two-component system, OmpR family, response regulator MprA